MSDGVDKARAWDSLSAALVTRRRESDAMSDKARDVLAALWIDHDDIADGEPFDAEWALGIVRDFRDAEHCGDCTNFPMTCNRCVVDEAYRGADAQLAALADAGLAVVPVEKP